MKKILDHEKFSYSICEVKYYWILLVIEDIQDIEIALHKTVTLNHVLSQGRFDLRENVKARASQPHVPALQQQGHVYCQTVRPGLPKNIL